MTTSNPMPQTVLINVAEFSDPLSTVSLVRVPREVAEIARAKPPITTTSLSIESSAMNVLASELERYCRQQISGRSFLISGHRGAGKTTMIQHAFRRVLLQSELKPAKYDGDGIRLRPLYVQLHGPSLFPDFADASRATPQSASKPAESPRPATATTPPRDDATPGVVTAPPPTPANATDAKVGQTKKSTEADADLSPSVRDARLALEQITLALHRAVSREFAESVWIRAREVSHGQTEKSAQRARARKMELAAMFEHELPECPSPMRLRDYWEKLGVLNSGVLRRPGRPFDPGSADAVEQGMRELVALAGVCDAYRRISGEFEQTESDVQDAAQKLAAEVQGDLPGRTVVPAITAMITGGLVGGGLALGGSNAIQATLGGFVAALGSSLVFKFSSSASRTRALKREYRFLFDTSIRTLDRVLPVLIDRLISAGLAPIFVVDELDKVDDLSDRIFGMVRHLKKLVAESAFFCFLTDRSYFEEMRGRGEGRAYPLEYSYFTHRLFISYGADDLHIYLGKLFGEPLDSSRSPDYPLLRYMLLHRSEMHALELHRLLKTIRDPGDGRLSLKTEDLRLRATYRMDIGLQLGTEILLDEPELQERIRDEPEFQRLVHDALLYPSRQWREGMMVIEFADPTPPATLPPPPKAFREYLLKRMNRSEATGTIERRSTPREEASAPHAPVKELLSDKDVAILWGKVQDLVELLSNPQLIDRKFNAWNARRAESGRALVDRTVVEQVNNANRTIFLMTRKHQERKTEYEWRYNRYGRDIKAPDERETASAMHLIDAFAHALEALPQ